MNDDALAVDAFLIADYGMAHQQRLQDGALWWSALPPGFGVRLTVSGGLQVTRLSEVS